MRGKDIISDFLRFYQRITPAYAGKRPEPQCNQTSGKDHPRLCGEKGFLYGNPVHHVGSPPPMRGKVCITCYRNLIAGITPAYAGKRLADFYGVTTDWDHPRLCGEKDFSAKTPLHDLGSPPPMRGKVPASPPVRNASGITPAYAGKRQITVHSGGSSQDHPRLCGEKFTTKGGGLVIKGSPPPMRGKAWKKRRLRQRFGITPAYAGKSCPQSYTRL